MYLAGDNVLYFKHPEVLSLSTCKITIYLTVSAWREVGWTETGDFAFPADLEASWNSFTYWNWVKYMEIFHWHADYCWILSKNLYCMWLPQCMPVLLLLLFSRKEVLGIAQTQGFLWPEVRTQPEVHIPPAGYPSQLLSLHIPENLN